MKHIEFRPPICTQSWYNFNEIIIEMKTNSKFSILGNVYYIVMKTCRAIAEIADQFIKWPTIEKCAELATRYRLADTIGRSLGLRN